MKRKNKLMYFSLKEAWFTVIATIAEGFKGI